MINEDANNDPKSSDGDPQSSPELDKKYEAELLKVQKAASALLAVASFRWRPDPEDFGDIVLPEDYIIGSDCALMLIRGYIKCWMPLWIRAAEVLSAELGWDRNQLARVPNETGYMGTHVLFDLIFKGMHASRACHDLQLLVISTPHKEPTNPFREIQDYFEHLAIHVLRSHAGLPTPSPAERRGIPFIIKVSKDDPPIISPIKQNENKPDPKEGSLVVGLDSNPNISPSTNESGTRAKKKNRNAFRGEAPSGFIYLVDAAREFGIPNATLHRMKQSITNDVVSGKLPTDTTKSDPASGQIMIKKSVLVGRFEKSNRVKKSNG